CCQRKPVNAWHWSTGEISVGRASAGWCTVCHARPASAPKRAAKAHARPCARRWKCFSDLSGCVIMNLPSDGTRKPLKIWSRAWAPSPLRGYGIDYWPVARPSTVAFQLPNCKSARRTHLADGEYWVEVELRPE